MIECRKINQNLARVDNMIFPREKNSGSISKVANLEGSLAVEKKKYVMLLTR